MKKLSTLLVLLLTMLVGGVNCAYAQDGFLDRSKWTVTVSSDCADTENGSQGWFKYLTDGDINTYWHSNWQGTTADKANGDPVQQLPQFIMVDLGEVQDVHTIFYAPRLRGANVNGGALGYEIYTSDEAFDYVQSTENGSAKKWYDAYAASHTPTATGAFSYENDWYKAETWKYASLPTVQKTRYVMFVIKSSDGAVPNKFANCAELQIAPSVEVATAFAQKKAEVARTSVCTEENISETLLGGFKSAVVDEWKNAITAATTPEEVEEVSNTYFYKKRNLPVSGNLYRIVSGNSKFYENQQVRKVLLSTGNNSFGWNTEDKTDVAQYWWITTDGDGFKFQNVKTGTYVCGLGSLNATGSTVSLAFPKLGVENFLVAGGTVHANGHNGGKNASGNIVGYGTFGSEMDGPSAWIIEDVTFAEARKIKFPGVDDYPTKISENVEFLGKTIVPVGTYNLNRYYDKQAKFERLMPHQSSLDGINKLLRDIFPYKPVEFEAGKYYRIVCPGPKANPEHNALSINSDNKVCTEVYDNASINQLWQVLTDDGGLTYYIQQANSGKYVGDVICASNKRIDAVSEKNLFELIQYTNVNTSQYRIHQANNGGRYDNLFAENGKGDGYACSAWENEKSREASWYFLPVDEVEVALTQVGEHAYATAHLPFAVSAVGGAMAYIGQLNTAKDHVALVNVSDFAANEGVVLMGESGQTTATLTIGGEAAKVENAFDGTNVDLTVDETMRETYRVLGVDNTDGSEIGFFKPSASLTTIGANRAYLNVASLPAKVKVGFGTVEGISDVIARPELDVNAPIYDLSGRRVLRTVKGGLYIQGGKKVIVK